MAEAKKSLRDFYALTANEIRARKLWELPRVEQDASIDRVLDLLLESDHVWVVEKTGSTKVVGIITEHDILHIFSPEKKVSFFGSPTKQTLHYESFENAAHLMSRKPVVCDPTETVEDVVKKMVFHRIRRISVVEHDELKGEITLHHLIKEFHAFLKTPARL